jgi:hypothetical protein
VGSSDSDKIFTAAAMGPPPTWRVGPTGPDAILFRSDDRGESFTAVSAEQGFGRGMLMRLKSDPQNGGGFFAVSNDGSVLRASADGLSMETIAEKLPAAYDFAIMP